MPLRIDPNKSENIQFLEFVIGKIKEKEGQEMENVIDIKIQKGITAFPVFEKTKPSEDIDVAASEAMMDANKDYDQEAENIGKYLLETFKKDIEMRSPLRTKEIPLTFGMVVVVRNRHGIYKVAEELRRRKPVKTITTEKIIGTAFTRKFKREKPHTEEALFQNILDKVKAGKQVKFVMYWGKGDRNDVAEPELNAIKNLEEFCGLIKAQYPVGVDTTFIFTDTHATINGYNAEGIKSYFESIKKEINKYGFRGIYLSELVVYQEKALLIQVQGLEIEKDLFDTLKESSKKHCKNFNNDYEVGAKVYYLQNQLEKEKVEEQFSDSIFLTYNGSELNGILPMRLPIFYMYPSKRSFSDKPWFI